MVLSVSANAQTQWNDTKLGDKISVKFPSTPGTKTANGSMNFVAKTKDSVTFTGFVLDYQIIARLDSTALAAVKDTQAFADQLRAGILAQRKDYTLGNIEVGKWQTYTAYQILGKKNNNNSKLYLKMIIIGSKMYGLSCLVPEQLATKDNEVFLNSLELTK